MKKLEIVMLILLFIELTLLGFGVFYFINENFDSANSCLIIAMLLGEFLWASKAGCFAYLSIVCHWWCMFGYIFVFMYSCMQRL